MSVSESFARIESWLSINAANVLIQLNKPISSIDELDRAELIIGAKLPPSVREAYRYHNGESQKSTGLFGGWRWLPLHEMIEWHEQQKQGIHMNQIADFKPSFMIPLLISTVHKNDFRYVEASDEHGEEETPVIEWNYNQPSRDVKYGCFANYLSTFAERLELGEYICDDSDPRKARGLVLKHLN